MNCGNWASELSASQVEKVASGFIYMCTIICRLLLMLLCNTGDLAWRSVKTERGTVEGVGEAPE